MTVTVTVTVTTGEISDIVLDIRTSDRAAASVVFPAARSIFSKLGLF